MKNVANILLPVLFLFLVQYAGAQIPAETVPQFQFNTLDKNSFTNNHLATGKMLFFFYFDPSCDHCQHAMQNLNTHYADYKKAAVYLISFDTKENINVFLNKYAAGLKNKTNVTLLQDGQEDFNKTFKPLRYPAMFLYDSNKKLIDYEDNPESMFRFSKYINPSVKK